MPLPRSLVQPFRQGQLTVGSGWRGYFAPFNQEQAVTLSSTGVGPTIYDLQVLAKFLDTSLQPVAGWFDLGWIQNFKFTPGEKIGNVVSGYRGAVRAKYRGEVGEKISFTFNEMTRMALRIARGTQVFNLLKSTATASTTGPLSSSGVAACPMGASGYQPSGRNAGPTTGLPTLYVPASSGALFPAGTMIVCDQDYNNTSSGFVGDAGANVFQGAVTDVDFIRKTSDYVNSVIQVVAGDVSGQDALILSGPFVGGGNSVPNVTANTAPTTGAKVQAIVGYSSRGGGTYISEWSGIFVLDTIDGSQILVYYPRLGPDAFAGIEESNVEGITSEQMSKLPCSLEAMAFDDPLDGETVTSYSAYYPHSGTSPQI